MISILIVDDDFIKISSIISSINANYNGLVNIKQASTPIEALDVLKHESFHLLITDLLMPLRPGENQDEKAGETLIKELYKKNNKVNVPLYIVGLTQFDNLKHNFSGVWNVWKYDTSDNDWKIKLRDLIFHISRIDSKIIKEKKETIFVEGPTDKEIIELAINVFFKDLANKVDIETISYGGGASWVARQIIIWGKTLFKKNDLSYLQATGIFDNDKAGREGIETVKGSINNNSAEYTTFSLISLEKKYARHIIPVYAQGLLLPITIEEMIAPFCWQHALNNGWLVQRTLAEDLLQDPQKWDKTNQSLKDFLSSLTIPTELNVYIAFKFNSEYKVKFVNYIKSLAKEEQELALASLKLLIADIIAKLKIT